jgi:hypothetical protein
MSKFLLDANVFIQAKRFYYPFDLFPGFWDWLDREMENGIFLTVEPIYKELTAGEDELSEWIEQRKSNGCILPVDDETTQNHFKEIAFWTVNSTQQFKQTAYEEFLAVGDSWLVAKAYATGATIVTQERLDNNCRKRILIPNACQNFGINYINTLELIRSTGAKFGLR